MSKEVVKARMLNRTKLFSSTADKFMQTQYTPISEIEVLQTNYDKCDVPYRLVMSMAEQSYLTFL